jgi:hypothetical protein
VYQWIFSVVALFGDYGLETSVPALEGSAAGEGGGGIHGAAALPIKELLSDANLDPVDIGDPVNTKDALAEDDLSTSCDSFVGVTPVLMADGSSKPIDQVKVGDTITNAPPGTSWLVVDQKHVVTAVHVTYTDSAYTDVTIGSKQGPATIIGTAGHLYWDATTHLWTSADQLRIGDRLQTRNGTTALITALRSYTASMVTYNLTIDNLHTYFVEADTTPVLVHNSNCPEGFDYEANAQSGKTPQKKGDLTRAGLEYQKHMGRGELPKVDGAELNDAGQSLLEDILSDPNTDYQPVTGGNFAGGYRIIGNEIVNNRFVGATFDSSGDFQYFGVYP